MTQSGSKCKMSISENEVNSSCSLKKGGSLTKTVMTEESCNHTENHLTSELEPDSQLAQSDINYRSSVSENGNTQPSAWSSLCSKVDSSFSFKKSVGIPKPEVIEDNFNQTENNFAYKLEPDFRLTNWKRWLDIHKEQQDKLSNILKRPPECLLMNMNLNNLHVNQQKQLIEDASEFKFSDKQRGHPCFWEMGGGAYGDGERLKVYRPIQKRYDRSRPTAEVDQCPQPRVVEYVGVPNVIMKEKGLSGEQCLPLPKVKWDTSDYVARKKYYLRNKLDLLQYHTPEPENLVVIGSKLLPNESRVVNFDLENTLEISDENSTESNILTEKHLAPIEEIIIVAIDDEILNGNLNVWTVYFENSLTNEFYEKKLTIQNSSDCSLRYSWDIVFPSYVDSPLPLKHVRNIKNFHFNKNVGVILPKSSGKFSFYFESKRAGVFHEQWKLYLSNSPDKEELITVVLQAVVVEKPEIEESLKSIDSYIDSCTKYAIASKTVKEILERSRSERPSRLPYDLMFFEEQIFVHNNPDLFYESKSVSSLKAMYKRVSEGPWDFSIQTLRKKLSEKALNQDMSETVREFTSTVCDLMKPKLKFTFTNEKHKSVYELLGCFINMIERESYSLKCILKMPLKLSSSLSLNDEDNLLVKTLHVSKSKRNSINKKPASRRNSLANKILPGEKTSFKHEDSQFRQTINIADSREAIGDELDEKKIKKQEYLQALYIKTYHNLCVTIDNISAVMDSFDAQKKKGPLLSLKENKTVYK